MEIGYISKGHERFEPQLTGVVLAIKEKIHHNAYSPSLLILLVGHGNITFQDSLDFDLSEIDSVYDNNEGLAKTMRTY